MGTLKLEDLPSYTYEDYKLWEGKWELINGIAYAMSRAPMIKHQSISSKIARYLDEALESCKFCQALLPIDWKIDENTVVLSYLPHTKKLSLYPTSARTHF